MSLGERVLNERKRRGMNQKQLAEAAKITQATVSRIESEKIQELKSEALKRLALAVGVTVDFLIGKTDKVSPTERVDADPDAQILFRGYEKLSAPARERLIDFVKFLEKQDRGNRKK